MINFILAFLFPFVLRIDFPSFKLIHMKLFCWVVYLSYICNLTRFYRKLASYKVNGFDIVNAHLNLVDNIWIDIDKHGCECLKEPYKIRKILVHYREDAICLLFCNVDHDIIFLLKWYKCLWKSTTTPKNHLR